MTADINNVLLCILYINKLYIQIQSKPLPCHGDLNVLGRLLYYFMLARSIILNYIEIGKNANNTETML